MNSFGNSIKNYIKRSIVPAIFINLFLILGFMAKKYNGMHISIFIVCAFVGLFFLSTFIISALYVLLDMRHEKREKKLSFLNVKFSKSWIYFLVSFAVILVLWLPSLMAFYPGLYCYDAAWQYDTYVIGEVTEHHPVIHTYLLGFLIDTVHRLTGSFNKGILAYTLAQMLIMGTGCAFIMYLLHRRKAPTWMHVFALFFFVAFPPFVIFVFSATKDSIFAIVIADFIFLNLFLIEDKKAFFEKSANIVHWIILILLVCILRNNAIYALLLTLPFFVCMLIKSDSDKKKAFTMIGLAILIYVIYKYPISEAVTVGGTSEAEMLSVPCQQIMRVYKYHNDELADEYKNQVERFFDDKLWYGYYVPEIADATKGSLRKEVYKNEKSSFFSLWLDLFKLYPKEYFDSILENTYGFYYPWPHYIIYSYGGEGYTPILVMQPGELNSKFPALLSVYKQFENGPVVQKMPIISWLFAPATYMYIALILAFYIGGGVKKGYVIQFIFLGLLWLTYLLGPAAMVRYALYLYALVPVWPAYIQSKES